MISFALLITAATCKLLLKSINTEIAEPSIHGAHGDLIVLLNLLRQRVTPIHLSASILIARRAEPTPAVLPAPAGMPPHLGD